MKNMVSEGKCIQHVLDATKSSGQGTIVGSLFGVCISDGVSGDEIGLTVEGIYNMPAATGDTFAVGAIVGYDEAGDEATAATLGDKDVAICTKAKLVGELSVEVKIVHGL